MTMENGNGFRQGDWVKSINALGKGLGDEGRSMISLDPSVIMGAAVENTGLSYFGEDDWFVEPLHALCNALETEAQLTLLGRLMARHEVQSLLQNRLRVEDTLKQNPEILDEPIENPIFVCGLGRSGTTVLHELLSEDPAHRVPQLWEMRHSVPPPESATYDSDPRIDVADREIALLDKIDLDFSTMHVNAGNKPNECIFLFGLQFLGDFFLGQYNVPSFVMATAAKDLTPVYAYHKKMLQLLQWKHPGERWVLKCPAHLARLDFLFQVYPDARIVVTHRDPLRVMSSMSNLTTHLKAMRSEVPNAAGDMWAAAFGEKMLLDEYMSLRGKTLGQVRPDHRSALPGPDDGLPLYRSKDLRSLGVALQQRGGAARQGLHGVQPPGTTRKAPVLLQRYRARPGGRTSQVHGLPETLRSPVRSLNDATRRFRKNDTGPGSMDYSI